MNLHIQERAKQLGPFFQFVARSDKDAYTGEIWKEFEKFLEKNHFFNKNAKTGYILI